MKDSCFEGKLPIIEITDSIILREIDFVKDAQDFLEYINNEHVARLVFEIPTTIEEAQRELLYWRGMFYNKQSFSWAVEDSQKKKMIGTVGFNYCNFTHNRTEISYELAYEYWGNGVCTKIVEKLTDFAIDTLGMKRIGAFVAVDNAGSIKVLEKNGYQREGCMKQYVMMHGEYKDSYVYGKIANVN